MKAKNQENEKSYIEVFRCPNWNDILETSTAVLHPQQSENEILMEQNKQIMKEQKELRTSVQNLQEELKEIKKLLLEMHSSTFQSRANQEVLVRMKDHNTKEVKEHVNHTCQNYDKYIEYDDDENEAMVIYNLIKNIYFLIM